LFSHHAAASSSLTLNHRGASAELDVLAAQDGEQQLQPSRPPIDAEAKPDRARVTTLNDRRS